MYAWPLVRNRVGFLPIRSGENLTAVDAYGSSDKKVCLCCLVCSFLVGLTAKFTTTRLVPLLSKKRHLYMQVYCILQSFGNSKDFIPLFTILLMTWFSMLEKERPIIHYNVCFLDLPIHLLPTISNKSDPFLKKGVEKEFIEGKYI